MPFPFWKKFSSFTYLNVSQFLVTINDSIFRLLVAYSLIDLLGTATSNRILAISGALFVLPFLIFSMPAGDLADKYCKRNLLVWTLIAEVVGMLIGVVAMHYQNEYAAYFALFCVALQAAVFNPVKYAILPEIVKVEKISKANGIMTLFTYLAIIFGTFLASFVTQISGRNYVLVTVLCVILAIISVFMGLQIEKTPVQNPKKQINPLFFVEIIRSLKLASKQPHLLLTIFASSYFLFTASYTQLNMIPFGIQSLGITDVQTGYVFLIAALGIGVGSMLVVVLSGKNVELGLCLIGAFGTAFSYILMYFFDTNMWLVIFFIFSLGLNGGLYIVPLDAYIQIVSPDKDRGEIVAGSSLLAFAGVLCAAGAIALLGDVLKLSAAEGYLIIGGLTFLVSIIISFLLPDYFTRFIGVFLSRVFFDINIKGEKTDIEKGNAFLLCSEYSFMNILTLIQLCPKIYFIRFLKRSPNQLMCMLYKLFHILPMPYGSKENHKKNYHLELKKVLNQGYTICVFQNAKKPEHIEDSIWQAFITNTHQIEGRPVIPITITENKHPEKEASFFHFFKVLSISIEITLEPPYLLK